MHTIEQLDAAIWSAIDEVPPEKKSSLFTIALKVIESDHGDTEIYEYNNA